MRTILYRSAVSEEQWRETVMKYLPLCHFLNPATHILFWKISKTLSKVSLHVSNSIKSHSACALISSSFPFSSKLEQWVSSRHVHTLFSNWIYMSINTCLSMRRSIFQSLDSPECPSKLGFPLNYTKAEVIEHILDGMLRHNFVFSIDFFSIFQFFKLPEDWFTVSNEGLHLTFPLMPISLSSSGV